MNFETGNGRWETGDIETRGHTPVLLEEVVAGLAPERAGFYVDATVGAGGHAEALLERGPRIRLLALDKDPVALSLAAERLARFASRAEIVEGNFADLDGLLEGFPAADGIRDRVASAAEAEALLAAVSEKDRPIWATALYAGLRLGELQALRWSNVDEAVTVISVEHGWDRLEGEIETKTRRTRTVPIVTPLRLLLLEHKARTGRRDDDLVFGSTMSRPFTPNNISRKARRAWALVFECGCRRERPKRQPQWARNAAGTPSAAPTCPEHGTPLLTPIGFHECRHSYVSLMHDAGFTPRRFDQLTFFRCATIDVLQPLAVFLGADARCGLHSDAFQLWRLAI